MNAHPRGRTPANATKIGFLAIVLWATLALLSARVQRLPPFELLASTFAVGGALGLLRLGHSACARDVRAVLAAFRQPAPVWALGVGTFFGFHSLYFFALKHAPAVHVSLIAYLWPLLLVLFSGTRGRKASVVGAAMGMGGVVLLVLRNGATEVQHGDGTLGYIAALACAFIWSGYSALNRRFHAVPVDAVTAFCLLTALLGAVVHRWTEATVVPNAREALAILALGLGPIGAAFFLWDYGTKYGDLRMLGVLSYATPLLSTLLLIAFGAAHFSWRVGLACLFITGGAWIAARNSASLDRSQKKTRAVDRALSRSTTG